MRIANGQKFNHGFYKQKSASFLLSCDNIFSSHSFNKEIGNLTWRCYEFCTRIIQAIVFNNTTQPPSHAWTPKHKTSHLDVLERSVWSSGTSRPRIVMEKDSTRSGISLSDKSLSFVYHCYLE